MTSRPWPRIAPVALVLVALVLFVALQFGRLLDVPFFADDFLLLDRTRDASFLSLWRPAASFDAYWRPWSRGLHYWALQRAFGAHESPFHLVAVALWLAAMALYFALARRLAGVIPAVTATAAVAALAAWSVLLLWIAGVQDLWMMVWALACLLAFAHGRLALAFASMALALLSKEPAAVLPGILLAYAIAIERRSWKEAMRRTLPAWAIVAAWAAFHPQLGGRLLHPGAHGGAAAGSALGPAIGRTLLQVVNLEASPHPWIGWISTFADAWRAVVPLAALVAAVAWVVGASGGELAPSDRKRVAAFGATWAILGWLPLLAPGVGWHAYYGLFGALGAWIAISALLRGAGLAVVVVAALALLRTALAFTPSADWGSEWYQWRAAGFVHDTRAYLRATHPAFPPHARVWFINLPSSIGLLPGGERSPLLHVWYGDTTLAAGFVSAYRPRPRGETGADFFFITDEAAGWREIDVEDDAGAAIDDPRWASEHEQLAALMERAGDQPSAARQWARVAARDSAHASPAARAAAGFAAAGDSAAAAGWFARAARAPDATEEDRTQARRWARYFAR